LWGGPCACPFLYAPSRRTDLRKDAITALAEPLVAELELEILEIELGGDATRRIVRILLDAERPVTLTDCETVSRRLSDVLDAHENELGDGQGRAGRYMLEVSSPGVNRPLLRARHFQREVGSLVRLKLVTPIENVSGSVQRALTARLLEADEEGVTVQEEIENGRKFRFGYDEIDKANVEYEFPENVKPGNKDGSRRTRKSGRGTKGRR